MKRLLVPIDFSACATSAFRSAIQLAHATQAEVHVLNVYRIKASSPFQSLDAINQLEVAAAAEARAQLTRFVAENKTGLPEVKITEYARAGFAIEEIIRLAESQPYDLAIMGTKGVSNLKEKILGTNTATVIQNLDFPVLAVPEGAAIKPGPRIACLTDLEHTNLNAWGHLIKIARALNATIVAYHIAKEGKAHSDDWYTNAVKNIAESLGYPAFEAVQARKHTLNDAMTHLNDTVKPDWVAVNANEKGIYAHVFNTTALKSGAHLITTPILALV